MKRLHSTGLANTLLFLISVLFLFVWVPEAQAFPDPPHSLPGPAVDRLIFRAFDVDRATRDLEAGNMDLYMFSLKIAAAQRLKRDARFSLYEAPASTLSLLLNPAPAPAGQLNPFSLREVRQAVHYLIDREFIARDIYSGMAAPMVTQVSPRDFDYLTVYDIEHSSGIVYDPEYGRELISSAMKEAGSKLVDGIWNYGGQPIRLRLIGRVEDERRNIADLVRTELERAGFMVAVSYRPFAAAVFSVYASDPQSFEWHIYTEGWGRSAPQRYDFASVNSMNAPWLGNMPGWQELGFWQYSHSQLDTLGKQLFRGEFSSLSERNEIYRRMTELGLDESVRIWLVTAVNSFPARKEVKGISRDPVAGLRSPWTLREAYIPGQKDLTVGHLWVWTERTTWNPVGGFGDVYSVDLWRCLHDPPIWNHPFTGIPQPMRLDYKIVTAGPKNKLEVPSDAVMWNSDTDRWKFVGSGVQAVSKVTFDYSRYFQSTWHHGQPITMADIFYSIAQGYELAYDRDKTRIEVALGVTSRPYLETFRGFRLVDDKSLEVYVDYWHFEKNLIASYSSPAGVNMPWEIVAAMDDLVFSQRRAAYSDTAASRFNVAWISLVMDRDARMVERTLRRFEKESSVPEGYFRVGSENLVSREAALERYRAALQWFKDKGHLVVSNGPFFLERYDPPAQYAELIAFRDKGYPFKPGDWDFGSPPVIEIERIDSVSVKAGQSTDIKVTVNGPGRLDLHYLLLDPAVSSVVTKGEAEAGSKTGEFIISLPANVTSRLFPGLYQLYLVACSDAAAFVEDRTVDVDVE